tara:strand:+ start:69 stop:683 length:615 start_codon:yes stop_codon:yes gene_type:complete
MNKAITYPIRKIGSGIDKLLAGASATVGAVGFSQIPHYINSYVHTLKGALYHATEDVAQWQDIADKTAGGSLDKLVDVFSHAPVPASGVPEPAFIETSTKIAGDVAEKYGLQKAYYDITNADMWMKPVEFIKNFDYGLAMETVKDFAVSIPLTPEGWIYAAVGVAAGVGSYYLVTRCGKQIIKGISRVGKAAASGIKSHKKPAT